MKDLDSYLNDHLAGSISALELIAHWVKVHKGEPLGSFFVETEGQLGIGAHLRRVNYGSYWKETDVACAGRGEIATVKEL